MRWQPSWPSAEQAGPCSWTAATTRSPVSNVTLSGSSGTTSLSRSRAPDADTGRDREVVRFLDKSKTTHEFLTHTLNLLKFLVPQYVTEGKTYLTIGIGCTGGRHRSVAIAEALKKGLSGISGVRLRVRHRDIALEG